MLTAGAAYCDITHELGSHVQGATTFKMAESIQDPLQANALYLKSQNQHDKDQHDNSQSTELLLISCDLSALQTHSFEKVRDMIATATHLPGSAILIGATHTHSAPVVIPSNPIVPVDTAYLDRLCQQLVELSQKAIASAQPAQLAWGQGKAHLGYNRRCCWADGSHTMHGDTTRPDFVGLEGPDDDTHTALAVRDAQGKYIAVLQANTAHPTIYYGQNFYSADFPGLSRKHLREALGDIPVLFFNGAQGDISCEDMVAPAPRIESTTQKRARLAHLLTGETLRLLYQATWRDEVHMTHVHQPLEVPVRLPDEKEMRVAQDLLDQVAAGQQVNLLEHAMAYGTKALMERYGQSPVDELDMHAIRIDGLAMVSQPCELFCQFGLDIRRRSPASATAMLGVTNGFGGYCPTPGGIEGGGYSGRPILWTRLHANAGSRIVNNAANMLRQLWP